jgi:hypothetical protein
MTPQFVIFESRPHALVGVQLAVLSLARHMPEARVSVATPCAPPRFFEWLATQENATVRDVPHLARAGWEVKPSLLLSVLEDTPEAFWIDSDIVLAGPIGPLVTGYADEVLVATEETAYGQAQGGTHRTIAWHLPVGRSLPVTVNTGVMRVTRHHLPLLEAWQGMLADPAFAEAQRRPWFERALHLLSDQEVLTALLGSVDFADVPFRLLRRGTDIAQCFGPSGYTPTERLRTRSLPPLVHAMGSKPWSPPDPRASGRGAARLRSHYERAHCELGPYGWVALQYADAVDDDLAWARNRHAGARVLSAISGGSPVYREFPLAVVDAAVRSVRRRMDIGRFAVEDGASA